MLFAILRSSSCWAYRVATTATASNTITTRAALKSPLKSSRYSAKSALLKHEQPLQMATDSRELRFYGATILDNFYIAGTSSSLDESTTETTTTTIFNPFTLLDTVLGSGASAAAAATSWSSRGWHPQILQAFQSESEESSSSTTRLPSSSAITHSSWSSPSPPQQPQQQPPRQGYGSSIQLTDEERDLFHLLRQVVTTEASRTTLRVAGGWVRDKLLATPEFRAYHKVFDVGSISANVADSNRAVAGTSSKSSATTVTPRLTSKFRRRPSSTSAGMAAPSMGRQGTKVLTPSDDDVFEPVDIDIALDDMVGRVFANRLNEYLTRQGRDQISVGVVLKNPEKSKHLETATLKVGRFWIDFVNLRAEEYTQDSRIPDLMRIGTAAEDAFRRDLTINALFYNVNTGQVEDWTGRGFDDLRRGIVATPLPPRTTFLDDPLRVLRSIRFAARLRFSMDKDLVAAAQDDTVRLALSQKVSRERVGGEVDLMLRSPDPVGAMRLIKNLKLSDTVFPVQQYLKDAPVNGDGEDLAAGTTASDDTFDRGLNLLSTAHDHLIDFQVSPPVWCRVRRTAFGARDVPLTEDDEARRLLWYSCLIKPLYDDVRRRQQARPLSKLSQRASRKSKRSVVVQLLVDDLKRPIREAEATEKIIRAAEDITHLMESGGDISATMTILSNVQVRYVSKDTDPASDARTEDSSECHFVCSMNGRAVNSSTEQDPVWKHAMELRSLMADIIKRIGPLWRAAFFLSISEQLATLEHDLEYAIEGDCIDETQEEQRRGVVERFDAFATAIQQLGVVGLWDEKAMFDGGAIQKVLPNLPKGPAFRDVMDAQMDWMVMHPGGDAPHLVEHLRMLFPDFAPSSVTSRSKAAGESVVDEGSHR